MCVCGGGVVCISGGEGRRVSTLTLSFSQSRESRGLPGMVAHGAVSMWYQVSAHLQELSHFLTSLYQGAQCSSNLFYHQGVLNPLPHPAASLEIVGVILHILFSYRQRTWIRCSGHPQNLPHLPLELNTVVN